MQFIQPEDINNLIKQYQYKYISLSTAKNKFGGFNQNPKTLNKKVDDIKKLLVNLPNDIYYINFKMIPNGDVFSYQYNKGGMSESIQPVVYNIPQPTQLEKFQTLDEWKKQEKTISDLQQELALLKLQQQFQTLQQPAPEPENKTLGFIQNVLPVFMPLAEKFFDLKTRELAIKERQVNQVKKPVVKQVINKWRPLPTITDPQIHNYLLWFDKLTDQQAENELAYVEQNNSDLYKLLLTNFYPDENENQENVQ
jgi:hypothetical protein